MIRLRLRSALVIAALATAGQAACDKQGSAPGGFGVNITVDATSLSMAERAKIKSATLRALSDKPGSTIVSRPVDKFAEGVQGGTVRFHYTPASSVKAGESLTFALDALGTGTAVVASGSSDPVELKATAVEAKIKLMGAGDGGMTGDGGEGGGKKGNGTSCLEGTECGSGFCSEGVCCNEKCDDVCVSCKLQASLGTCTPYAVDTDPEMECTAKLPPVAPEEDAGATPSGDGAAGGDASGEAAVAVPAPPPPDGGAMEVAQSDASTINQPDGGFMSMPNKCGGACSGARSCKYPGSATTCGKAFCNTRRDVGSFVCDGNGGCNIQLSACEMYACDEGKGACNTLCAGHADCQIGSFCNGEGHCVPRKDIGLTCTTAAECRTGHCSTGVCCNTQCDAPFSCNDGTHPAGQCACPGVSCPAGVACQVFYQDGDADTFGNRNGTIVGGTAKAGCAGTPPVGFVADNTDCDDGDANAKPGQTGWFNAPSKGTGTFDYNCDGMMQKETPEYPGKSCHFCGAVGTCDPGSSTCATANQTASFVCPQEISIFTRLDQPIPPLDIDPRMSLAPLTPPTLAPTAADPGAVLPPAGGVILPPTKLPQCCGCAAADKAGFLQAVNCGDATKYVYTCGSCAAVGQGPSASTKMLKQQQCH
jgi:hypothetical protein